ncbi:MAG: hypothetical protein FJX76_13090 [Armatimonadetes bacterium]|nr:hypothetical protein [Armatimonadota bacterium]
MSRWICWTLPLIAVMLASGAWSADPPVGYVVAIDGKLERKPSSGNWAVARLQQPDYVGDHLRTDKQSMAAVEFTRGGKVGVNTATEILIVGPREAKDVTERSTVEQITVQAGSIWAKFAKQSEQFKIQTESCTIGIRGTEFVVEQSADGETEVSVLEGEVEVVDSTNEVTRLKPGQYIRARRGQRARLSRETEQQMRQRLERRHARFTRFWAKRATWRTIQNNPPQRQPVNRPRPRP